MILIKRVLFNEFSETRRLNSYSEAIKGIYSAMRLNEVGIVTVLYVGKADPPVSQ